MSTTYDLKSRELALATVTSELDKASRDVSEALAKVVDLRERRAEIHINPTDGAMAIQCLKDLEAAEKDLDAAEDLRDRLIPLMREMQLAYHKVSKAFEAETQRLAQPAANEKVAEDLKLFATWVQKHRETLDALKNAGLPDAGMGFTEPYAEILKRFAVRPDLGSMR